MLDEEFECPEEMGVEDWRRLFEYLKRKGEINIEPTKLIEGLTRIDYFVGVVLDPRDKKFGRICRINTHDWRESGDYFVTFADKLKKTYSDRDPNFGRFYRKPDFLKRKTEDSFRDFLLQVYLIEGDFKQIRKDYKILFNEDMPH